MPDACDGVREVECASAVKCVGQQNRPLGQRRGEVGCRQNGISEARQFRSWQLQTTLPPCPGTQVITGCDTTLITPEEFNCEVSHARPAPGVAGVMLANEPE